VTTIRVASTALSFLATLPFVARAAEGRALDGPMLPTSEAQPDLVRRTYLPDTTAAMNRKRARGYSSPSVWRRLALSFQRRPTRLGAADLDFRIGYGFSDRFQMFMDFNTDVGSTNAAIP